MKFRITIMPMSNGSKSSELVKTKSLNNSFISRNPSKSLIERIPNLVNEG